MYKKIKRLIDLLIACILLIIISPILVCLSLLVRLKIGSPIFFRQERTGRCGKKFEIMKFRTMTNEKDKKGDLLPDEMRCTSFGQFLRSSSLDELPELFNIIRGEMSIIGPRPLPPIYDKYYTEREMKRFEVRSGLIPPDSVDKKAIISWDKQLEYEAKYAEDVSFKLDLKILIQAFGIILKRSKINYGGFVRQPLDVERKKNE